MKTTKILSFIISISDYVVGYFLICDWFSITRTVIPCSLANMATHAELSNMKSSPKHLAQEAEESVERDKEREQVKPVK